jgi:nucleoside-diphosphate-sugar epimerase
MATSQNEFPHQKATELIGWEPKVPYEEGMKRTIKWLEKEFLA